VETIFLDPTDYTKCSKVEIVSTISCNKVHLSNTSQKSLLIPLCYKCYRGYHRDLYVEVPLYEGIKRIIACGALVPQVRRGKLMI